MRLLPKSEIHKLKAEAQKQSIDEGVKLAKRVDRLREVASEEEASLARFRTETLASINKDIVELDEQKSTLTGEIKHLFEVRNELLVPLDAEWDKVSEEKERLVKQQEALEGAKTALERERNANIEITTNLKKETNLVAIKKGEIEDNLNQSRLLKGELKQMAEVARLDKIRNDREYKQRLDLMIIREQQYESKKEWVKIKEAEIRKEKSDLVKEWRLLKDRQETLERSIKRFK
jgi:hypothetical protein